MSADRPVRHSIRSYVRREGRMTPAQRRAIDELWPRYGVDPDSGPLRWEDTFGRDADVVMEIGYGNGHSLAAMAEAQPEQNFFGVEVYRPGTGSLLREVRERGLSNVRVSMNDGSEVLARQVPESSLDRLQIFFPDPWPKKRHHKRRLLQAPFVALAASRLKPDAVLHVATDWQPYAEHILTVMDQEPALKNTADGFAPRPDYRPATKYEQRGQRLGHGVWDIVFCKVSIPSRS